jgi:hypothetical protein
MQRVLDLCVGILDTRGKKKKEKEQKEKKESLAQVYAAINESATTPDAGPASIEIVSSSSEILK